MITPSPTLIAFAALAALGAFGIAQWSHRRSALRRLQATFGQPVEESLVDQQAKALQWVIAHLPGASDSKLKTALLQAGYLQPAALPIFVVTRFLCTAAVLAYLLLRDGGAGSTGNILLAIFLAFFCNRLFVILLKLWAESRQREIRRELPPVVDVLLMVLNSGISIDQCLRYVTGVLDQTAPLTNIVLKKYVADIDNGMAYETAFERMGQRLGIDEGYDLANLIKQALLQGGEIMALLERFGEEVAEKRVSMAREQIGRKAILLTIIMLAFFMPVLLITLAGPAVSNLTETLHTVKQELRSKGAHK